MVEPLPGTQEVRGSGGGRGEWKTNEVNQAVGLAGFQSRCREQTACYGRARERLHTGFSAPVL